MLDLIQLIIAWGLAGAAVVETRPPALVGTLLLAGPVFLTLDSLRYWRTGRGWLRR